MEGRAKVIKVLLIRYIFLLIILFLSSCNQYRNLTNEEFLKTKFCPSCDFEGPLNIEDVEKEHLVILKRNGREDTVPFGYINKEWKRLKRNYKTGAELYHFRTDKGSWLVLCGQDGYVLIRNKRIIGEIISSCN
jgi:hypothetical protein